MKYITKYLKLENINNYELNALEQQYELNALEQQLDSLEQQFDSLEQQLGEREQQLEEREQQLEKAIEDENNRLEYIKIKQQLVSIEKDLEDIKQHNMFLIPQSEYRRYDYFRSEDERVGVPDCNYLRVGLQSSALSDRIICNYKLPLGQN